MALPEADLHRIHLWTREQWPEHMWDEVKVEADVADRHGDIVEVRPLWDNIADPIRHPSLGSRFTKGHRTVGDLLV